MASVETFARFATYEAWKRWISDIPNVGVLRESIVASIEKNGLVEPVSQTRFAPSEIQINRRSLREGVRAQEFNSRKRGLLLQLTQELRARGQLGNRRIKILGAEALTKMARILRGSYPMYLGTEYIPDENQQKALYPVKHCDLESMTFADDTFDVFISGDVFEHIADLPCALSEIFRTLKPGGFLVSSFPFSVERQKTLVKARREDDGTITHLMEPEYHGNPVDPENGSLVFSLPGWDLLVKLKSIGFEDAHYAFCASAQHGVVGDETFGVLNLVASKPDRNKPKRAPLIWSAGEKDPKALISVLGMPRSGTTLFTSSLSVHSEVEALFEPWNAGLLDRERSPSFDEVMSLFSSPDPAKTYFVVKETAADRRFPHRIAELANAANGRTRSIGLVILRDPIETMRSEQLRRNEWWGDDVNLDQIFVDRWLGRFRAFVNTLESLRQGTKHTLVLTLEEFSRSPAAVLKRLEYGFGLTLERHQLEYEQHLRRDAVRGDLNVAQRPSAISPVEFGRNDEVSETIRELASKSDQNELYADIMHMHRWVFSGGQATSLTELLRRRRPSIWK